jgi:hypothetical protein
MTSQNRITGAPPNALTQFLERSFDSRKPTRRQSSESQRERLVEDRRQLAADLAKSFKGGDEKKRALFTATQAAIEAIDRAIADEHAL